nr:hypothetical protein [Deltaproteobacteria bacterium]
CSTCECDSATGVECSVPEVRFFNNSSCFGDPQSQFNMNDAGVCTVFTDSEGAYGAESDEVVPVVGTGSCTATGGGATLPNVQWGTQLRACETLPHDAAGCGDGRGCAPPPSAEFGEQLCIYRPGDVECPDGDFSERRVRYLDFEDNRGCTACECGSPTGGSCNVDIEFSYVDECIANYVTMTDPGGGCLTLFGEPPHSGEMVNTEVTGASCGAFGGEPQGVVAAADPVTVCCNG